MKKKENKLIEIGVEIAEMVEGEEPMTIMPSIFCQVGLPRSKVDGTEFLRRSGKAWINIQAGMLDEGNGPVMQPIPYGSLPRLALAWISTFSIREKTPVIPLGNNPTEFLRLMGMLDESGRRYETLRKQLHALAACRMQMGYRGRTLTNISPVKQFEAWVITNPCQNSLWPGVLTLSDEYYNELKEHGVPLNERALMALHGSSMALDIYCFMAQRLHRIDQRLGITIKWPQLRQQFGQEYTGKSAAKDFKKAFLVALKQVLAVYPKAKAVPIEGGIQFLGSPPPISYRHGMYFENK